MFDINKLNEYKENNRLEAKKATDSLPRTLWETYSSFANSYGGVILLGASENTDGSLSISGIDNSRKMLTEFWNLVNNPQKVSTNLLCDKDVELIELDGKYIIVVHVPRAERDRRPVYINNNIFDGTFRRNWEGDYHCTQAEVKAMLRDQPEETQI